MGGPTPGPAWVGRGELERPWAGLHLGDGVRRLPTGPTHRRPHPTSQGSVGGLRRLKTLLSSANPVPDSAHITTQIPNTNPREALRVEIAKENGVSKCTKAQHKKVHTGTPPTKSCKKPKMSELGTAHVRYGVCIFVRMRFNSMSALREPERVGPWAIIS